MPTDYAGNSLNTARTLTVNANTQILSDWVGATDTDDFYRFTLTNRSSFSLGIDGLTADADVRLLDSSGNTIQQSSNSGTIAEEINSLLEAGTYYLRVYSNDVASTNYSLRVLGKVDLAGNSLDTARAITVNSTTKLYSESVSGTIDPQDYYRFTLNSTSNFNLTIDGLSGYSNVELFNSYGNWVGNTWSGGNGLPQSINSLLAAGTYYIRVNGFDPVSTNYDLRVAATPDLAGNTLDTARAIALSSTTRLYSESIGGQSDSDDYYRFTLSNRSIFKLSLDGWGGNGNVELFNSNGNWIDRINLYAGFTTINNVLAAGTYYIRVNSFDSTIANYDLRVSATPDLAGNDLNTARAIAISPTTRIYFDSVGSQFDSEDYYRFSLNNASAFNLDIDGLNQNADVQLLDTNGNLLYGASSINGWSRNINSLLTAGTYYIKVNSFDGINSNYELRLNAISDLAGNTTDTARAIAVSSTTRIYSDSIGGQIDNTDYYRFALNTASALNLNINGLTANANMELLDSNSNLVPATNYRNDQFKNIISLLEAGTYYIRVNSFGTASTNYDLRISAKPDLAGNTFDTARAIAISPTTTIYSESIGGEIDIEDYYRFTLNSASTLNLNIDRLIWNANVQLLDSNSNLIEVSNDSEPSKSINSLLAAGTYYIRVYSFDSLTANYDLRILAAPQQGGNTSVASDLAGNTFDTARAIALSPTTRLYSEFIGGQFDSDDYYRFALNTISVFNLTLDGLSANANVQLLDSYGNGVGWSSINSGGSPSISSLLTAGTYYIRVSSFDSTSSRYDLRVVAEPDLAGNTFDTARTIALSPTTRLYSEFIGSQNDTEDYYRFTLNTASNFNLSFGDLSASDVSLLDSNGNWIYAYTTGIFWDKTINTVLTAGTYYIKVYSWDSTTTTNYDLRVSATPDLAGNTFDTARAIAVSPTTTIYSDSIGGYLDSEDYYRFNLNTATTFNLTFDGLNPGWANVQLLDSNGNLISEGYGTNNGLSTNINSLLAAGTYYIGVHSFDSVSKAYEFRVATASPDLAGNDFNTAKAIAISPTTRIYSDSIGDYLDSEDYYRFTLNTASNFNLTLDGLNSSGDVQLFDSNGNSVFPTYSNNNGSSTNISSSLAAGTYYIKLNSFAQTSRTYDLLVSATPDLAGNDFNTAKAIAISPTTTTYSESVGGFSDPEDNYRFTLNATSVVNLNIDGLGNNPNLQLFDINGNAIASTYPSGSSSSISSLLGAGTYYVKIVNYYGPNSNYNLRVSAAPEIAGDTLNTARTINVGTKTTTYSESISSQADTSDYYRFSLSTNRFLNLALDGLTANADVELLDSSGNTIKNSINWGTSEEYISEFLAAGTYYLRVYPSYFSSGEVATNYNLRLLAS